MATSRWTPQRTWAWRLLSAAPAVLLSTLLMTVAFIWLNAYEPVAVAAWLLGVPLLVQQRRVERFVVRALFHFRAPAGRGAEWLNWVRQGSEHACAVSTDRFDWYVINDSRPNAYAVGRRSIAVTSGLLGQLCDGRLTQGEMLAVAWHEIGHHATGGLRHGLAVWWLTWPWRTVHLLTVRLARRFPLFGLGTILMPVVLTVAVWRVASNGGPAERVLSEIALLTAVGFAIYIQPLVDAAIYRADERAADDFVASLGASPALARVREQLDLGSAPKISPSVAAAQHHRAA